MNATHKRRLLMVADLLDKLPRKRFDYAVWVGDDWEGKPDLSCGTTACALGWATTIPALRRAGLRLFYRRVGLRGSRDVGMGYLGYLSSESKAAKAVFGLDREELIFLFTPSGPLAADSTPKQVARHIRKFVANGGIYEVKQ